MNPLQGGHQAAAKYKQISFDQNRTFFEEQLIDFFKKNNETYERQVNIRFLSTVNGSAPVTFYPSETNLEVMTDKVSKTSYIATNNTNKRLTLSIVPSVSPGLAAENVKKIQCFCFSEQTLVPYESQEWPV